MGTSKPNNVLKIFGVIGSFLLNSIKAGAGAKNNQELVLDAFNVAGGYILSVEHDLLEDGTARYKGIDKLTRVAQLMALHYSAQSINMGIIQAMTIAQNKFLQMHEEGKVNATPKSAP